MIYLIWKRLKVKVHKSIRSCIYSYCQCNFHTYIVGGGTGHAHKSGKVPREASSFTGAGLRRGAPPLLRSRANRAPRAQGSSQHLYQFARMFAVLDQPVQRSSLKSASARALQSDTVARAASTGRLDSAASMAPLLVTCTVSTLLRHARHIVHRHIMLTAWNPTYSAILSGPQQRKSRA